MTAASCPDAPDAMWGTDATVAYTTEDGEVWLFAAIDRYTTEAWIHIAARESAGSASTDPE